MQDGTRHRRRRSAIPSIGLLILLAAPVVRAQSPDLRGLYVYSSDVSQISNGYANVVTSALAVPDMDGIVLVISWSALEPSMGQYQWATLDQWMQRAVASRKKVDLAITAGTDTPAWLFLPAPSGAGAQALTFTISPHSGATGVCDSETIAAPWTLRSSAAGMRCSPLSPPISTLPGPMTP
jgi:Beta-galactosidase